jgi:hypothetical protein
MLFLGVVDERAWGFTLNDLKKKFHRPKSSELNPDQTGTLIAIAKISFSVKTELLAIRLNFSLVFRTLTFGNEQTLGKPHLRSVHHLKQPEPF